MGESGPARGQPHGPTDITVDSREIGNVVAYALGIAAFTAMYFASEGNSLVSLATVAIIAAGLFLHGGRLRA